MENRLKIGVCTLSIGNQYKQYTKYTRENKILYCKKHNYDFIDDESIYNKDKPIPWSKILQLQKYLKKYDYLVWIDADIYVMNSDVKLESFIEKYKNFDIICGSDWKMINTGVFFIKNSDFSNNFLQLIYDNVYDPHSDTKDRYLNWEQGSFINLWDRNEMECRAKIKVTNPIELNSYWFNYFPGHFVLHFAGVRGELLSYLTRDYCPDRMDIDTDKSYDDRMKWLAGPVREHLDDKLKEEKEMERLGMLEHLIDYKSETEYLEAINKYDYLFEALLNIVKSCGEYFEGNCFYYDRTYDRIKNNNKAINLFSIGAKGKKILEIGFNAGHSCLLFLLANPENTVDCFDICVHSYSKKCFEYLSLTFPGRLRLFEGDSKTTLLKFKEDNPNSLYDVIHIDGSHELNDANCDFYNTLYLSKKDSIIIFDDINIYAMKFLWDGYVRDNHVKEVYSLPVDVYPHVIGKYLHL